MPESEDKFWDRFVATWWEKRSVVLRGEDARHFPNISPEELFPTVVACSESFLAGIDQRVRLYVEGDQVDIRGGGHGSLLPKASDGSFEEYNDRMVRRHGLFDYALVMADWHQFSRPLWNSIVHSVDRLASHAGVSASRMDTQAFVGTYRTTPFGVHVDAASAFHFPVVGKKRMRFWEDQVVKEAPALRHAKDYRALTSKSVVHEALPGDVIYWPASYWHVGESDRQLTVTWRFAYWIADGMRRRAMLNASQVFEALRNAPLTNLPPTDSWSERIDGVEEILRDLATAAESRELRRRLISLWLEQCSAFGFVRLPALESWEAVRGGIRRISPFQLYAARVDDESACVAAAGRSCFVANSPRLTALVARLNRGEIVATSDIETCGTELLELCRRSGAFEQVDS